MKKQGIQRGFEDWMFADLSMSPDKKKRENREEILWAFKEQYEGNRMPKYFATNNGVNGYWTNNFGSISMAKWKFVIRTDKLEFI